MQPPFETTGLAFGAGRMAVLLADTRSGLEPPQALAVDPATGAQQALTPLPPATESLAIEAAGTYLAADLVRQTPSGPWVARVHRVDPATGASAVVGQGPSSSVQRLPGVSVAPDGGIVLAAAGELWRMDPQSGALAPLLSLPGVRLEYARVDLAGRVFTLDEVDGALLRFDPATGVLTRRRLVSAVHGAFALVAPRCADGFDDDGDGAADWPADPECGSRHHDSETGAGAGCGLGAELVLAALAARRRRLPPA